MLAFSPDLVDRSDQLRRAAAERAQAMPMPTAEQEVWRYSRIGDLQLDRFHPVAPVTTVHGANGYLADRHDLDTSTVHDVFDELSSAFHGDTVLSIPRGTTVNGSIVVTHTLSGNDEAVFPRLVIDVGENSEVTVVERFMSSGGGGAALLVPRLFVRTQQAARLTYVAINELSTTVWQLGHQQSIGERDSTTLLATVALGGQYARVRTDAKVVGQGASTRQVALYYADDNQMHDFRTLQDHVAPRTTSDLLFKGAVQDTARSVYTGLIRIGHDAKGSVAYQTNRNLTLSAGAWAESVPNLEIETNDVKCSHASTIGPIDEEQRFYLESRGIPPETAERLVVLGFFDEVLAQLPVGPLAAELRQQVAAKLDRRSR
ncbi:MAG: Fe-S cluster assembly protein SufD [Ilumatobacteraceae bacterium]